MSDAGVADAAGEHRSPLDALDVLASQEVWVDERLRHVEIYTMRGLLTLLWHGDPAATDVVLACGGAMGGLLGPADGLYHDLGRRFADDGIALVRVGYRRPDDLPRCVHDLVAAADLASRSGGRRFVTMGHSFGGAVAIQAAVALGTHCHGVVGLATQSAGCEVATDLGPIPLLLLHGTADELLPPETSDVVATIAGHGEVEHLPEAGHLLREAGAHVRERLSGWIPRCFSS